VKSMTGGVDGRGGRVDPGGFGDDVDYACVGRGARVVLTKTWNHVKEMLAMVLDFTFDRIRMRLSGGATVRVKDIPFACL